jgi:hypothetical protein
MLYSYSENPAKSCMVAYISDPLTIAPVVSQWAEMHSTALAERNLGPMARMNSRAGWSSMTMAGGPCDRNNVGRRGPLMLLHWPSTSLTTAPKVVLQAFLEGCRYERKDIF